MRFSCGKETNKEADDHIRTTVTIYGPMSHGVNISSQGNAHSSAFYFFVTSTSIGLQSFRDWDPGFFLIHFPIRTATTIAHPWETLPTSFVSLVRHQELTFTSRLSNLLKQIKNPRSGLKNRSCVSTMKHLKKYCCYYRSAFSSVPEGIFYIQLRNKHPRRS
jgi:hypothetical protein